MPLLLLLLLLVRELVLSFKNTITNWGLASSSIRVRCMVVFGLRIWIAGGLYIKLSCRNHNPNQHSRFERAMI